MRGWTRLWEPCLSADSPLDFQKSYLEYSRTTVDFSPLTQASVCDLNLRQGRCSRAAVSTLTPILVQKMVLQAFLSPVMWVLRSWVFRGSVRAFLVRYGVL